MNGSSWGLLFLVYGQKADRGVLTNAMRDFSVYPQRPYPRAVEPVPLLKVIGFDPDDEKDVPNQ